MFNHAGRCKLKDEIFRVLKEQCKDEQRITAREIWIKVNEGRRTLSYSVIQVSSILSQLDCIEDSGDTECNAKVYIVHTALVPADYMNNHKAVRCIETGVVYSSLEVASKHFNTTSRSLSMCLSGKQKTAMGYHFEEVE